jgi:hypothetical protein
MPADRIEIDTKALGRLLKSDSVRDALLERGKRAAEAAGEGFEAKVFMGFDRVSVVVAPGTSDAITALYADSTVLTRAIDAARD